MPDQQDGFKPLTARQIDAIRYELSRKRFGLDKQMINYYLSLPQEELILVLQRIVITIGPLSSFPIMDYPFSTNIATTGHLSQPEAVEDPEEFLFEFISDQLMSYNAFLKGKVTTFDIQMIRSLAAAREITTNHGLTVLRVRSAEMNEHNDVHTQTINSIRTSLDASEETNQQKLGTYRTEFLKEVGFLRSHKKYFAKHCWSGLGISEGMPGFEEHDNVLKHIQQWSRYVNVWSPSQQYVIDGAREHVNQLVMTITHQCQVQLATVFQESQFNRDGETSYNQAVREEAAGIIQEIDWLWEEVIPVAHMSVSAQFLKPVLGCIKNWESSQDVQNAIVITYAAGVLRFLNERLSAVAERTQVLVYHHQALYNAHWLRGLKEANANPDIPCLTATEMLQAFMQTYGIVPIDVENPFPHPSPSVLDEYVQQRAERGDTLVKDLHRLFEGAAKAGLTQRDLGGELLLESVMADSSANPVQTGSVYQDTELEHSIAMLRNQSKQILEVFSMMNLDGPAKAPDYVAHAYRQTAERLAGKIGVDCFRNGANSNPSCMTCVRCLKFEEFVRRWGS